MIGISSACYYSMPTRDAFMLLLKSGVKVCEMFFNTSSEIAPPFCSEIKKIASDAGVRIDSVHPFSSFIETGYFFSDYEGRIDEGIDIYRRYFEGAAGIGARFFVFHGANLTMNLSPERYAERLYLLSHAAKEEGVCLCQENVSRCLAGQVEYVRALKSILGNDISFTLDIKQANRAGQDPFEMAKAMGENIKLVHINDYNEENDCLLPCKGNFDLKGLKSTLDGVGYDGNYIIEVYRKNYTEYSDIEDSYTKLNKLFYS
jgi:sugar phosphate isomerase/epimerase